MHGHPCPHCLTTLIAENLPFIPPLVLLAWTWIKSRFTKLKSY